MISTVPRIVVAGTSSGVGKTTVATAIMAALKKAGMKAQPFKAGPDYIDPGYHTLAASRISRNLDGYLMDEENIIEIFARASAGADIAVIEGVMGLFDGDPDRRSSTAAIAKILRAPVILVIDAGGMGQSVAAVTHGFSRFDPGLELAGVILNNIGSDRHAELLDTTLTGAGVKIFGRLRRSEGLVVKERHLGLVPAMEESRINLLNRLPEIAGSAFEIEEIEAAAKTAKPITWQSRLFGEEQKIKARIGVAWDKAFSFYYQDNLDILRSYGAELVYFSPLEDKRLPGALDGLYLGGGFPEVFAGQLSANVEMKTAIKKAVGEGMPTYGECGGLVYLTDELSDLDGRRWKMCGAIRAKAMMNSKLQALGYRRATAVGDNLITGGGENIVGHEFHYSSLSTISGDEKRAYRIEAPAGESYDGFTGESLLASYIHLHFASNPAWAMNLIEKCHAYGKERCVI